MKNIIIKEESFKDLFDDTLSKLELVNLKNNPKNIIFEDRSEMLNWIDGLHRKFHYEVCLLKERLEKTE